MQNNAQEELNRGGLTAKEGPLSYEDVLIQAQLLSREDRIRLLEELITDLKESMEGIQSHSITELRGVGKEFWRGIDVEKYIEEERSSWDG